MTPTVALILILAAVACSSAVMAPVAVAYATELKRAQQQPGLVPLALVGTLSGLVALGMWWYYALATDQILLGVIPTVSILASWMFKAIVRVCG